MLEGWRRAGGRVRTARTRAGYTAKQFAEVCGISERTLWALEKGERDSFSDETLNRIEAELGWEPGSLRRLVEGGQIRYVDELRRIIDLWPRLDTQTRTLLAELAERAARG